jgi:outer membrane phospholipase A
MRAWLLLLLLPAGVFAQAPVQAPVQAPDWLLVSASGRAQAGAPFELVLAGPEGAELPDSISARVRIGVAETDLKMEAVSPAENGRRRYAAVMPPSAGGAVAIRLVDPPSNVVVVVVLRSDRVQSLTGAAEGEQEPPLSENEAMYFVVGASSHWSARYQLSFKYRLFDYDGGFGREHSWLTGLYFAYTQTSLWDLEGESKPFFDTSYRPSLFWRWTRNDDRTWIDGVRVGLEHESNGQAGTDSRSMNIVFVRPEWRWKTASLGNYEFTPKVYYYLDKSDNPDIEQYRGYVDWRGRWDSGDNWIVTVLGRLGTARKGSIQIDLARRARDMKLGPVSGYFYMQYFNGYGESLRDYDKRHTAQLRFGLAIIP